MRKNRAGVNSPRLGCAKQSIINRHSEGDELFVPEDSKHNNVTQGEAKQSRKAAFSLAEAMKRFFTEKNSENCLAYCSEQKFLCETAAKVSSSKRSLPMNLGLSIETTSERKSSKASFLGTFWRNKKCHKTEKSFNENSRRKAHVAQSEAQQSTKSPVTQSEARQSRKAAFLLAEAMSGFYRCVAAARTHFVSKIMEWNTCLSKYVAEYQFLRTCNNPRHGFSLAEAMITLLMVSIILSALAPIMTKKMRLTQTGFSTDGGYKYKQELTTIGSGTWSVPSGLQELAVTIIGAGGGGGAGLSSGEKEWTTPGTYNWTVPNGVTEIEVTLVSGGAGGGAGNVVQKEVRFVNMGVGGYAAGEYTTSDSDTSKNKLLKVFSSGTGSWAVPDALQGSKAYVVGCGGGGGGGNGYANGFGGGSGVFADKEISIPSSTTSLPIMISYGGTGGLFDGPNLPQAGFGGGGGANGHEYGSPGGTYGGTGGGGDATYYSLCTAGTYGGVASGNSMTGATATAFGGGAGGNGNVTASRLAQGWEYKYGAGGCSGGSFGGGGAGGTCCTSAGGGGGAAVIGTHADTYSATPPSYYFIAPGGGGGGGGEEWEQVGSGGGGGGGKGGGRGGNMTSGGGGTNSGGKGYGGATPPGIPSGYCNGGTPQYTKGVQAASGAPGFIKLNYLDFGNGGSGGGGGAIVPSQKVKVTPGETLTIIVGAGGAGGIAGSMNPSGGIVNPTSGDVASSSRLLRGGIQILNTNWSAAVPDTPNTFQWGPSPGYPSGITEFYKRASAGIGGPANNGYSDNPVIANYRDTQSAAKAAGNLAGEQLGPFANGTVGGDGGITAIDGVTINMNGTGTASYSDYSKLPSGWCKVAKGGTSSSRNGQSASGFGGCGGGGGYGLGAGGNGAGGYARIRWNQNQQGAGGGGGSSNVIYRKLINIQSATGTIPYIIGDGGIGGGTTFSTSTYRFNDGGQGEATSFGAGAAKLEVKGGLGGQSSYSTTTGTTGDAVTTTYYGGAGGALLDKSQCLFGSTITICYGSAAGTAGTNTNTSVGGIGANLEYKNTVYGKGGSGSSTGDGQAGDLFGSGGGGGGVKADTNTKGGKGAPGKIILEWK